MNNNIKSEYKEAILKAVAYHYPNAKVILFGSRARGTHKPGADVDIALDVGHVIPLYEMGRMRQTMENLPIALEVDIVDMHTIPEELRSIILEEGIIWKS